MTLRHTATLLLAPIAMIAMGAHAQSAAYKIDKAHSEADFSIRHMAISNVHGRFGNIEGAIVYDPSDVTKSTVEAKIDISTVDTGVAQRDTHLKSADFFDVAKYPSMTFKSTSVKKDGDGFDVDGNLTLHGVTKMVTLKVDAPSKEQLGMDGKTHARGFEATATLNRKDFGLNWNGTLKSGDAALGDDVKISISIEAGRE
ncbi:YceI family protein [Acidipila sp. EB88]|uniref:YceI family protein n=1 Tax=Acidipila sp. EB88 TaxID=2305226 RepID=UPI000F5EEB08|nr:YceI family protein [Acidipila sp. EB88]RRA50098.1 polyisoprenoid-binding protein [Acidipila sp. EB88]